MVRCGFLATRIISRRGETRIASLEMTIKKIRRNTLMQRDRTGFARNENQKLETFKKANNKN